MPSSRSVAAYSAHPLSAPRDALAAFESLRADPYPWLLDSALPSPRLGRFSLAGADPYLVLRARGRRCELECRRAVRPGWPRGRRVVEGDPFELLRSLLSSAAGGEGAESIPFVGGAVGYLGYELADRIEKLDFRSRDDLGLPDLYLLFVDRALAYDHGEQRLYACGLGFGADEPSARRRARRAASELADRCLRGCDLARRGASRPARGRARVSSLLDESGYAKRVDEILEQIAAGNVYQANLTRRLELPHAGDPWRLYRRLRRLNPAPFASYLGLPEVAVLSSSPERFLRLGADGRVESRPIKGTRPRGASPSADAGQRASLAASAKDRAENLMIVDLVRNDLGRVCEAGSVEVPELMAIEPYASVFQMVSTVTGRLRRGADVVDLLRASFPPGSMTGAPKLAAIRILEALEPVRRGIYSGAIGYFDARGGADLSVVIRTILLRRGRAYVHVGGGVVADSTPAGELRETEDKARALLAALGVSRRP